jgi:TIR domain
MRSLTGQAIEFYSCFISYSSKNHEFAERLHADLQDKGVRCWFAPEDLKIGDRIRLRIDESIRLHDKLLLVLSEESVKSQWVEQEVETALAREREQNRIVLFPIRLDESVMGVNSGWPSLIKNTRHIGDFSLWKAHDSYKDAFARLIRDLKAED